MSKAWAWLKRWGAWLAGGLVAVLGALIGAGWLWRRHKAQLGAARDEAAIAEARREMDTLRARREILAERLGEQDESIAQLDTAITASKRRIVELHEGGADVANEDLDDAFRRLGY